MQMIQRFLGSRIGAFVLVAGVFGALIVLAPLAAGNMRVGSLSNKTVHIIAHCIVWSGVTLVLVRALPGRLGWAWLIALGLAFLEEWHQAFVPGRFCRLADFTLNFSIVTGVVLIVAGCLALRRRSDRPATPAASTA